MSDDNVVWRHSDGTLYRLRRRNGESDADYAERKRRISKLPNLVLPPDSQDAAAAIARLGLERIEDVPPEPGDEMPPEVDDGMPPHMIALFEDLADTPYDIAAVDAAAKVYAAAVQAAGGAYGHALAAVWRAWHREKGGGE